MEGGNDSSTCQNFSEKQTSAEFFKNYGPKLLKKKATCVAYIKFPDERIERTEKMLRGQLS